MLDQFQLSNPVWQWWLALSAASAANVVAWFAVRRAARKRQDDRLQLRMVALAGVYVFVCAFRSVVPRADVQRITLFDAWFATVLAGRAAATAAELSFVAQWSLALHRAAKLARVKTARYVAAWAVPAIAVAECFSWYAVISTNYLGNVVEESIWATVGLGTVLAAGALAPRYRGAVWKFLAFCFGCALAYVAFMVLHDVPMYVARWRAAEASGQVYLPFWEGLRDLATRRVVTFDISDWREEIPWMSFYFTLSVWFSLGLCLVSLRPEELVRFLRPASPASPASNDELVERRLPGVLP